MLLRVAQGGILINAGCSVLAQRLNVPRACLPVLLVPYGTLAVMGLAKTTQKRRVQPVFGITNIINYASHAVRLMQCTNPVDGTALRRV